MTAIRQWTGEHELLHWLLVILAALVLTLVAASVLGAGDPTLEPQLLPRDMNSLAKPLASDTVKPFFPESPPIRDLPPAEAAARVAEIIAEHRAGQAQTAINQWATVGLQPETAHWREIALGAGYLQLGDLQRAEDHLVAAQEMAPGHAVAAYFTGLLRLEQAAAMSRVPEGRQRVDLLVSYTPPENRAVYRMLAIAELEAALRGAHLVRVDEPLVVVDPLIEQDLDVPKAGDLIGAIGAANFPGKAHHVLFGLRLDRGELAMAEQHLERAAATGIAVLHGYQDLAEGYLLAGENCAAIRCGKKDFALNHPEVARFVQWLADAKPAAAGWVW